MTVPEFYEIVTRRSCVSSSTYDARRRRRPASPCLVHHDGAGPMEFQMRVRLRVRNCQNEFSSGRAYLRIIRGPPTTRGYTSRFSIAERRKQGKEKKGRGRRRQKKREREGRIEKSGAEESTGPKQGHQKMPRTTNHRGGGLRLPQMPEQREEKKELSFSPPSFLRPFAHLHLASVPLVLSVIARPGRFFARRLEREDLLSQRARRQSDLYSNESRWKSLDLSTLHRRPA